MQSAIAQEEKEELEEWELEDLDHSNIYLRILGDMNYTEICRDMHFIYQTKQNKTTFWISFMCT